MMINRFSKTICLVLVAVFVVTGCKQGYKEGMPPVLSCESKNGGLIDPDFIIPYYAYRAIEAAGGRQGWAKAKVLRADCVVTFYQPDGSFYITEQHHEIHPRSNSILISAQEPEGRFVWQLSGGRFDVLEGDKQLGDWPMAEFYPFASLKDKRDFAEAILNITTVPVRFLDDSAVFTRVPTPVKIEGLWYYPIERATAVSRKQENVESVEPYWSKIVFYQDRDSSLVGMIWFADVDGQKFLMVRGYDYQKVENGSVLIPARIEIFQSNARGVLQRRLVKVDYYS